MKELIKQYAAYHVWANQRLFDLISAMSPEETTRELTGSFPSLHTTLLHMLDAESIWWQRLKLQERIIRPSETINGTTTEVITHLQAQSRHWEEWVQGASGLALEHVFEYRNLKGQLFKLPVIQMLLHVFNHGTYHRGQLVSLLRQSGITTIPSTDYVTWFQQKK